MHPPPRFLVFGIGCILAVCAPEFTCAAPNPESSETAGEKELQADNFMLKVEDLPDGWEKKVPSPEKRTQQMLAALVKEIRAGEFLADGDMAFLRRHRAEVAAELHKDLRGKWQDAKDSFAKLLELEDEEARKRWFAEFIEADAADREALLGLDRYYQHFLDARTPEEEEIFRKAIKAPKPTLAAADRLGTKPGVAKLLLDAVERVSAGEKCKAVEMALDANPTSDDLQWAWEWLQNQISKAKKNHLRDLVNVASEMMKHPELAPQAEKIVAKHLVANLEANFGHAITLNLERYASKAIVPELEKMLKGGFFSLARGHAVIALARLRGAEMLPELKVLAAEQNPGWTWSALAAMGDGGAREQADGMAFERMSKGDSHGVSYAVNDGGPGLARKVLEAHALHPDDRFWLHWKAHQIKAQALLDRLLERKLISRMPEGGEKTKLEILRKNKTSESQLATTALEEIGAILKFHAEPGGIPPNYEQLFREFTHLTQGAFAPRDFRQTPLKAKPRPAKKKKADDEDEEEEFDENDHGSQIEFSIEGKRLVFQVPPRGEWYDVPAVQAAVNKALEISGRIERVLPLYGWGREVEFVYGPPEAWREIAKEFRFPLAPGLKSIDGRGIDEFDLEKFKSKEP